MENQKNPQEHTDNLKGEDEKMVKKSIKGWKRVSSWKWKSIKGEILWTFFSNIGGKGEYEVLLAKHQDANGHNVYGDKTFSSRSYANNKAIQWMKKHPRG